MPDFTRSIVHLAGTSWGKRAAEEQVIVYGKDPTEFDPKDPLRLWSIQFGIIILTAQLLGLVLHKIRQPRVIAEVLGGIILGPTAFGRIPGFTEHIFPEESLSYLSLAANIGLVLFLFLVGLEIEIDVIKKNARYSLPVAAAGMVLPFGLGAALAIPIYNQFVDQSIPFAHFMLFTGVAFSITAFPVLCRILTELKLVDTTVGIVVLSAGVGNDIVGWTLLALSVALVNSSSGLMSLWILLTAVGWTLFLLFPVKYVFKWLAHRTGSIENGPSMFFMTVTIMTVFGSAFFTDIIGVHAIFGGFLAGLVVPREGGLAIALTEKLEDMVSIIFLPLYFALSGLSTNLGLLNDRITWCYTMAICVLAYVGKFGGCTAAAKLSGFDWREASTIGTLMSCKGLVELIVLNVGLSAGILTPRVFSMFVLEALLLTFMTTPVVAYLYPPEHRTRASPQGNFGAVPDWPLGTKGSEAAPSPRVSHDDCAQWKTRFTVVLDKLEHLPGIMTLTQLIRPSLSLTPSPVRNGATSPSTVGSGLSETSISSVTIDALRLIELSDRTSAVMKSSAADSIIHTDPLLTIFKTFGELNDLPMSTSLSVVTYNDLAHNVADHAKTNLSQLVLVPWLLPTVSTIQPATDGPATTSVPATGFANPFDMLFKTTTVDKSASLVHSHFIRGVFSQCDTDVALFVDRTQTLGDLEGRRGRQQLFVPFLGGPDDRLALEFAVQLCSKPNITATVIRVTKSETYESDTYEEPGLGQGAIDDDPDAGATNTRANSNTINSISSQPDTVYGQLATQTRLQSETADNIAWARYATPTSTNPPHSAHVVDALSRMTFTEVTTPTLLHTIVQQTTAESELAVQRKRTLIVALGRSRRLAVKNHALELKQLMEAHASMGREVKRTIGDVATAVVLSGCNVGLIVMQAADRIVV